MIHAGTMSIGSGRTCVRRGRVLDELHQPIAEHDLAGRDGDVAPDVRTHPRRPASCRWPRARQSSQQVVSAAHEIHAGLPRACACNASGLVATKFEGESTSSIWRVANVDHVLVLPGDAAHAGHRVVPPLLGQQERLVDQVERRLLARRDRSKR